MPDRKIDPRSLAALTYTELAARSPRSRIALLWTRACGVIRRDDLFRVTWPDILRRQTRHYGLGQMLKADLLQAIDEQQRVLKLGRHGARILKSAGIPSAYKSRPSERVLPGLLLASEFGTALGRRLMEQPHVSKLTWAATPFAGVLVRPDSTGEILYDVVQRDPKQLNISILTPEPPYLLGHNQSVLRLCLEIDRVSQSSEQLTQRIENWRAALQSPYLFVPHQTTLAVLWVTSGTWRRARTIAELWQSRMLQAAFYTTEFELRERSELHAMNPLDAWWMDNVGETVLGRHIFKCVG
jgi:hypothetical protein